MVVWLSDLYTDRPLPAEKIQPVIAKSYGKNYHLLSLHFKMTAHMENTVWNSFSIVAYAFIAMGTYLMSHFY
jgi:hypothetical protein